MLLTAPHRSVHDVDDDDYHDDYDATPDPGAVARAAEWGIVVALPAAL